MYKTGRIIVETRNIWKWDTIIEGKEMMDDKSLSQIGWLEFEERTERCSCWRGRFASHRFLFQIFHFTRTCFDVSKTGCVRPIVIIELCKSIICQDSYMSLSNFIQVLQHYYQHYYHWWLILRLMVVNYTQIWKRKIHWLDEFRSDRFQ